MTTLTLTCPKCGAKFAGRGKTLSAQRDNAQGKFDKHKYGCRKKRLTRDESKGKII